MTTKKRFLSMLVLLAAVVTGAWAQGSVNLSVTNVYNGNNTDKVSSGCLVYFLTTTMASIDSWASQPSLKAFKDALDGKYSNGLTSMGTFSKTVSNSSLGITDGASVTSYLLIFNSSEITEGVSYYITNTYEFTASTSGTVNAKFGNQGTNSQNSGNWHEVPVAVTAVTANEGATGEYWATYYDGTTSYTADDNTTVYQAAVNGTKTGVVLTEVTDREIPAGKAVVLKSSASTITLTPATTTQTLEGNQLQGVDAATAAPANAYCLSKETTDKARGVGFYTFTGTIPAHRAYLVVTDGPSSARGFLGFDEDDNTTGIGLPEAVVIEGDGPVFDLSGRRIMGQPQKGIYVKNGKKFVIK